MSNRGFQEALAHLLVSEGVRNGLVEFPESIAARFELTPAEVRQLAAIDSDRLGRTAEGIVRVRGFTLKRIFATAFRASESPRRLHDALANFLTDEIPASGEDEASRWLAEGQRFVAHLSRIATDASTTRDAELARSDWLRCDLLYRPGVEQSAQRAEACRLGPRSLSDEQVLDRLRLVLGRHVRLAEFSCEVLDVESVDAASGSSNAPGGTLLALRRHATDASISTYRLTRPAFAVLGACDGTRSLREIGATWYADTERTDDLPGRWAELGRFALTQRLLVDSRDTPVEHRPAP